DQREQRVVQIAGGDRHVFAETERVELVYPREVARLDAAGGFDRVELRAGQWIQRPAFRAVLARRLRSIERSFAFTSIEAREVAARERRPDDPAAIDVHA